MVSQNTALFRARVPARRLKNASRILKRAGLTPGEAVNAFLAQVEINNGLPFRVLAGPEPAAAKTDSGLLRTTEQTLRFWNALFDDAFSR